MRAELLRRTWRLLRLLFRPTAALLTRANPLGEGDMEPVNGSGVGRMPRLDNSPEPTTKAVWDPTGTGASLPIPWVELPMVWMAAMAYLCATRTCGMPIPRTCVECPR